MHSGQSVSAAMNESQSPPETLLQLVLFSSYTPITAFFWAILLQDILNIAWILSLSLSWLFSLIRIPLSGRPEYRLPTHPTMPPYSSVQKQAISQFVAFTQAKDPLAAKVLPSRSPASFWLGFACCRPNLMSRETMADIGLGYSSLKHPDGMLKRLSMRECLPFLFCFKCLDCSASVAILFWLALLPKHEMGLESSCFKLHDPLLDPLFGFQVRHSMWQYFLLPEL